MRVVKSVAEMRQIRRQVIGPSATVKFVPTMGSLHIGHAALIKAAKESHDDVIIVSIFVNPLQFNNQHDFVNYPNTWQQDLQMCTDLNVDFIFLPKSNEMYPNFSACADQCRIQPMAKFSNSMEGSSRPGHFSGMLTVVNKLFNIVQPQKAYFGEKDYQQLILVDRMVRDLDMDIKICPVQTVRDTDSLPFSSRNARLGPQQRKFAGEVMSALLETAELRLKSMTSEQITGFHDNELNFIESILKSITKEIYTKFTLDRDAKSILGIDYLDVKCSEHFNSILMSIKSGRFNCDDNCAASLVDSNNNIKVRIFSAIIVDGTRLLDNKEILL